MVEMLKITLTEKIMEEKRRVGCIEWKMIEYLEARQQGRNKDGMNKLVKSSCFSSAFVPRKQVSQMVEDIKNKLM